MTEPPPMPPRMAQRPDRPVIKVAKVAPLPVDRRRLSRHRLGAVANEPQVVDKSEKQP